MFNIASYLEKFKNLKDPKRDLQEISFILSEVLGFQIPTNSITLRNNNILFTGDSSLKSEIFLKREVILETLNKKIPNLHIKDIR